MGDDRKLDQIEHLVGVHEKARQRDRDRGEMAAPVDQPVSTRLALKRKLNGHLLVKHPWTGAMVLPEELPEDYQPGQHAPFDIED